MKRTGTCAVLLLAASAASGQDPAAADAAYDAGRWDEAVPGYAALLEQDPASGRNWYRLAVSRWQLGEQAAAGQAFEQAAANGVPRNLIDFQMARLHAQNGEHDAALAALAKAAESGFSNPAALEAAEFDGLRGEQRYMQAADAIRYNSAPCEHDPAFRAFDFWIGDWQVVDRNGVPQGTNRIAVAEQGCLLTEHWRSAAGGTGQSMNYYDPERDQWVQHWVSNGLIVDIAGGIEGDSMVLRGRSYYVAQGREADFRGTWTPLEDGRVRQFFEESRDGGQTWQPWFEGYYARRERESGDNSD